ncbi:MAG: hypothetical protein JXB30_14020 [Anaerolineae bacterium]|nr:hypothetical protein [Anaerolineae bacterium]
MPKAKQQIAQAAPELPVRLDEKALEVIMKEYDALRELYSQAEAGAQSIFNFYLTLVTTVGGAIVLILQLSPPGAGTYDNSQFLISGLLVFAAVIGSVYLSSLTGRYAHMSRYAQGIDAIRRHLIETLDVPMPAVYRPFLTSPKDKPSRLGRRLIGWTIWLGPTGTYQLFIAAVNSLSLAAAVWLFLLASGVVQAQMARSILAAVLICPATFVVYNIYSRLIMNRLVQGLGLQVDTLREMPFITGKQ